MPSPNHFFNSMLSTSNEFSLALASVKNDFSLVKIEAPQEYAPLGSALSSRRRIEAEDGSQHRTARRLGALFEDYIPNTPKLVTAYGLRVSEIMREPGVNPPGSTFHGPFKNFVGADATAAWAAATSGVTAIAVYLLACLLARAFESNEATSIWAELVVERRCEIERALHENRLISEASLVSARQEISRSDLARWDGSARAWLRSADDTKKWERHQLRLVTEHVNLPFDGSPSTFSQVTSAWRQAMLGMEDLLNGRPQSVSDVAIVRAFSAWHLYPDLIVLGKETINVPFRDDLVPASGVATIGLGPADLSHKTGMKWSLALSHLRYYGAPVPVVSNDDDNTPVTIEQLRLVALGALLDAWHVSRRETSDAAEWFRAVWQRLGQNQGVDESKPLERHFAWLFFFYQAAETILTTKSGAPSDENFRLISFGRRRGKDLFGEGYRFMPPFFGLGNPHLLTGLREKRNIDCGIEYLRGVAQSSGLTSHNSVIVCGHWLHERTTLDWPDFYEYASAVPHERYSAKRDSEGHLRLESIHVRWLHLSHKWENDSVDEQGLQSNEKIASAKLRAHEIEQRREHVSVLELEHGLTPFNQQRNRLEWRAPPMLYQRAMSKGEAADKMTKNLCVSAKTGVKCRCFDTFAEERAGTGKALFCLLIGDWRCGLFVTSNPDCYATQATNVRKASIPTTEARAILQNKISPSNLWNYFCCLTNDIGWTAAMTRGPNTSSMTAALGLNLLAEVNRLSGPCLGTMFALSVVNLIYERLEGGVISLKVIYSPLDTALWLPELFPVSILQKKQLFFGGSPTHDPDGFDSNHVLFQPQILALPSRAQTFSCITHMESGALNVDPADLGLVLAMSSANSIYVAAVVLSDPSQQTLDHHVRRLVGNVDRAGYSMLVAPRHPQIRPLKDSYVVVNHAPYDLKREDNFAGTSLHLSFSEWTLPVETDDDRTIDQQVRLIESVISLQDRGTWVADLDILGIDFSKLVKLTQTKPCLKNHHDEASYDYTSLDNWEELLDTPETTAIFRAHGNWAARLAAVSILFQKNMGHCIGVFSREDFCLKCLEGEFDRADFEDFESSLPSFCID